MYGNNNNNGYWFFVISLLLSLVCAHSAPLPCAGNCPRDLSGNCKPLVTCFVPPCSNAYTIAEKQCLQNYPFGAVRCANNFCGGCNRVFVKNNTQVCQVTAHEGQNCSTSNFWPFVPFECDDGLFCKIYDFGNPDIGIPNRGICTTPALPPCPGDCPRDEFDECPAIGYCFEDPCNYVPPVCKDKYRNYTCEINYCGGCFADWFDEQGNEACSTLAYGAKCTLSGTKYTPCEEKLFCNITNAGDPANELPSVGTCSDCVPYTLCKSDSDCTKFGKYFKCVENSSSRESCVPTHCSLTSDCKYDFKNGCSSDCMSGVGYCAQVM